MRARLLGLIFIFFLFGGYNFGDVGQAVSYYGERLVPSNPTRGMFVFIFLFFLVVFTEEIINLITKSKTKINFKENFK